MATLSGKVAIVTGASRGIGRATAERLGADGAEVVVNYVQNAGKAQQVVEAVEAAGSRAVAVRADVGRVEDVRRLFQAAEERFGGVDVVINNASVSVFKAHAEVSEEEFDRVFGLIARGTFFAPPGGGRTRSRRRAHSQHLERGHGDGWPGGRSVPGGQGRG